MNMSDYFVHESAYVDEGCVIGAGTKIWHFTHVMTGARIGERCNIGQNVVVSPGVVIGNNVKIQNNVSVYTGVILEDDVFCGPSMVFTNVVNPRSHVPRKDEYRETLVKRGASIGANATVVCGHSIGQYAFVGAGAVVTRHVPDYALVVGNPGRVVGWMCECGVKLASGPRPPATARCERLRSDLRRGGGSARARVIMQNPAIRARDLTKVYRLYRKPAHRFLDMFGMLGTRPDAYSEHAALDRVSLDIGRGEKVAIIGRNGAGKSTFLKLVTSVIEPSSGSSRCGARSTRCCRSARGFIPTSPAARTCTRTWRSSASRARPRIACAPRSSSLPSSRATSTSRSRPIRRA